MEVRKQCNKVNARDQFRDEKTCNARRYSYRFNFQQFKCILIYAPTYNPGPTVSGDRYSLRGSGLTPNEGATGRLSSPGAHKRRESGSEQSTQQAGRGQEVTVGHSGAQAHGAPVRAAEAQRTTETEAGVLRQP